MLEQVPSIYLAAGGGIPGGIIAALAIWDWWRKRRSEDGQQASGERVSREDRARAAHDAVWQQVHGELARTYRRVDIEEALAQHWEAQAREQHGALWEMRALVLEARRAATEAGHPAPPEWSQPIIVLKLAPPPPPPGAR